MGKTFISTFLLFAISIGFLLWGISMLVTSGHDAETIIYALLILGCSGYAFVSLLMLPRKKQQ